MFWICRLGSTDYSQALQWQLRLREARLEKKIENLLLLTSHPPVFTMGKRECRDDFLSGPQSIEEEGIQVIATNRGGKITYHGPGQVVGYFIADLRSLRCSIPDFVRRIEELLIQTLSHFGVSTHRDPEHPGVWKGERKLAAIGLHFDRGVSVHGFALNVNPDLTHYRHIIPCGIRGREVSSMEKELECPVQILKVERVIEEKLGEVFETEVRGINIQELMGRLNPPSPSPVPAPL